MRRRTLLKDISKSELEHMREGGMTNQDIANALDISISTVYRMIGAQGGTRRGKHTYETPVIEAPAPKAKDEHEAALVVEDRTISLAGLFAGYKVKVKSKEVVVFVEDDVDALVVPFDQVKCFADELSAISRHIEGLRVGNEMW